MTQDTAYEPDMPLQEERVITKTSFYCSKYSRRTPSVLVVAAPVELAELLGRVLPRAHTDVVFLAVKMPAFVADGRLVDDALSTLRETVRGNATVALLGFSLALNVFHRLATALAPAAGILFLCGAHADGQECIPLPENIAVLYDGKCEKCCAISSILQHVRSMVVDIPYLGSNPVLSLFDTGIIHAFTAQAWDDVSKIRLLLQDIKSEFIQKHTHSASMFVNRAMRLPPEEAREEIERVKAGRHDFLLFPESAHGLEITLCKVGDTRGEHLFCAAAACEAAGNQDKAEKLYCRAALENPVNPYYVYKAAVVYEKYHLWAQAAQAYSTAIGLAASSSKEYRLFLPDWHFSLARVLSHQNDDVTAAAALVSGLQHEDLAMPIDARLVGGDKRNFIARREICRCVQRNIARIRSAAARSATEGEGDHIPRRIFTYWHQGIADAPELIQNCRKHLLRSNKENEIVVLDETNILEYADIPEWIMQRHKAGQITTTFFSDFLRSVLLSRHGGLWVDATCLTFSDLCLQVAPLKHKGFLVFRYSGDPLLISSWFMAVSKNNYVISAAKEAMCCYLEEYDDLLDYFTFHHLIAALLLQDDLVADIFAAMPFMDTRKPHMLQNNMQKRFDATMWRTICKEAFIHKLTYRLPMQCYQRDAYLPRLGLLASACSAGRI